MPKLILFVRRKPGLTHEEFRDYYESTHAPLARSRLPHMAGYTRNYLSPLPGQPEPPYDCVTEFWFEDQAALEANIASVRGDTERVLARDEENFMDRPSMRTFLSDEISTSMPHAGED